MTAGGVYAEMFKSLLKPFPHRDGVVFKVPMDRESIMPIIPVENYGKAVKWALKHPQECIGKLISAAPFPLTLTKSLKQPNKSPARRLNLSLLL